MSVICLLILLSEQWIEAKLYCQCNWSHASPGTCRDCILDSFSYLHGTRLRTHKQTITVAPRRAIDMDNGVLDKETRKLRFPRLAFPQSSFFYMLPHSREDGNPSLSP